MVREGAPRRRMDVSATTSVAQGYTRTSTAWRDGPGRIYNRLAQELVSYVRGAAGGLALDLGAGTGAASAALLDAGASVVACDLAEGMLAVDRVRRPPCVAADALALSFRDEVFDVVVAAFSLNHITRPDLGLREAARVTKARGCIVASAYSEHDNHPVKAAADRAARAMGWESPAWQEGLRCDAMPLLATVERAQGQLRAAGLCGEVEQRSVAFPDLTVDDLIEWRLGMAHLAPFVGLLTPSRRNALVRRTRDELGELTEPLVRKFIVITARV